MSAANYSIAPYLLRPAVTKPGASERPPWIQGGLFRDLLVILARQWRVMAATVAVIFGVTAAYCLLVQPRYRARATVLIEARSPQVLAAQRFGEAEEPFGSAKYDYYQTQFQLLRSPSLAKRVIQELKLAEDPRFVEESVPAVVNADDEAAETRTGDPTLVRRYLRQLDVQPVRATRLVNVEFESPDPELAAEVANAHARLFVSGGLNRLYESMQQIRSFLQTKLKALQVDMQVAETALLNFQSANRLLPVDLRNDVASERLMDISRRLTQAEAERIVLEAQYRLLQRGDHDSLPAVLTDSYIQRLREDYNRMELEHALLAAKWRPTYPALRQLSSQLDHARELLRKETEKVAQSVEAKYIAAKATSDRLQEELDKQRRSLLSRKDAEGQLLTLSREAETTRALYDNLLARVKELDAAGGADVSNMTVAEPALVPHRPSTPNTRFDLLLSLVTGLLLGTGIALLRGSSDRTIRDAEGIQRATGLGTLAVIPEFEVADGTAKPRALVELASPCLRPLEAVQSLVVRRAGSANGNLSNRDPHAGIPSPRLLLGNGNVPSSAEAYRTLRTSLLLNQTPTPPRVIVIASAVGTEGKTTTAVNTAASLASCGATVLLVDGDLRLPRCHEALSVPLEPGLSGYLAGEALAQPIQATRVKNLSFVAAGRPVQNPAELLTSWRMWQFLKGARDHFDFVVIDSPPLLAVSDGLLLANVADGVLLVVESGRSREEQLQAAMLRLHQTGAVALGAVLNRGEVEVGYYDYSSPWGRVATEPHMNAGAEDRSAPEEA